MKKNQKIDGFVENKALPVLRSAIRRLLTPLIKIVLRNGMPYRVVAEELKKVYVQVAEEEFLLDERKQSNARVAIITGISRKEVSRIRSGLYEEDSDARGSFNRAARVITAWIRDPGFQDESGNPLSLPIEGRARSFTSLVRQSSGDMLVRAMLDELVRVGAVEVENKHVRLINRSYIPASCDVEKLRILGTDVASLVETVNHNLHHNGSEPHLQRKVYYDNLPKEALSEIRQLSKRHGQEFIELVDQYMRQHDRDVNPEVRGEGEYTAGVGVFYFESETPKEDKKV